MDAEVERPGERRPSGADLRRRRAGPRRPATPSRTCPPGSAPISCPASFRRLAADSAAKAAANARSPCAARRGWARRVRPRAAAPRAAGVSPRAPVAGAAVPRPAAADRSAWSYGPPLARTDPVPLRGRDYRKYDGTGQRRAGGPAPSPAAGRRRRNRAALRPAAGPRRACGRQSARSAAPGRPGRRPAAQALRRQGSQPVGQFASVLGPVGRVFLDARPQQLDHAGRPPRSARRCASGRRPAGSPSGCRSTSDTR